jgi:SAM-dependent methyltransferase
MELTEQKFWDDYWGNISLPSKVNMNLSFERCLANELSGHLGKISGDAFEVGCAPGKWLSFLAKEFGLRANGIEYSAAGMKATLENFRQQDLQVGEIFTGDFLTTEPMAKFDLVISLGFIEHFDNPNAIIERHLAWLKPGGRLVLGVPNFNGIYYFMQKILDPEILEKHNLSIMNLNFFKSLEHIFPLKLNHLRHLGSLEPSLLLGKKELGKLNIIMVKFFLGMVSAFRKFPIFDKINHPCLSSYILSIYTKNLDE